MYLVANSLIKLFQYSIQATVFIYKGLRKLIRCSQNGLKENMKHTLQILHTFVLIAKAFVRFSEMNFEYYSKVVSASFPNSKAATK